MTAINLNYDVNRKSLDVHGLSLDMIYELSSESSGLVMYINHVHLLFRFYKGRESSESSSFK